MTQQKDYSDWSDTDLADELAYEDKLIESYQAEVISARKKLNRSMERREDVLEIIKQRATKRKGWTK